MSKSVTVKQLFQNNKEELRLIKENGKIGFDRKIKTPKLNRPGLELTGFWQHFRDDRILLFGMKEDCYLKTLSRERKRKLFEKLFMTDIPAAIFAHSVAVPEEARDMARKYNIGIFTTTFLTTQLNKFIMDYLDWELAPSVTKHGTLVDVYGVGILFTGKSGIGKSEVALDLIERGHRLVSDDSVKIIRRADNVIIGMQPGSKLLRHHLEVRGLGIIDAPRMFGVRSIRTQKRVEVEVRLEIWDEDKNYERLGLDSRQSRILDVSVPMVELPIVPGKNITVIAETIAMNHMLKVYGKDSASEFDRRLEMAIKNKTKRKQVVNYLKKDYE
ncbi:MAG: HPr(Ser) kinase/phosphatase [Candidatus Marinimicrobia bacterium]|nr:HPr(Ser) kinase/phosphatase [Candidatus Neomarinimicrobiota bacterium]